MTRCFLAILAAGVLPHAATSQGLREVPQRFVHVQPLGLIVGMGTAGYEFTVGRTTTLQLGGLGVYSEKDGIKIYGGGGGIGVRQYVGEGEPAGVVIGTRIDVAWLQADNSGATRGFLSTGALNRRRSHVYLGLGASWGYRLVSTSGWFAEPTISYEYFLGPRTLVPGSHDLQEELGLSVGIALGMAW